MNKIFCFEFIAVGKCLLKPIIPTCNQFFKNCYYVDYQLIHLKFQVVAYSAVSHWIMALLYDACYHYIFHSSLTHVDNTYINVDYILQ